VRDGAVAVGSLAPAQVLKYGGGIGIGMEWGVFRQASSRIERIEDEEPVVSTASGERQATGGLL